MATTTRKKKKPAARKPRAIKTIEGKDPVLDIPVTFGNVSIGDTTCRVGLRIERENLNVDAASEFLCGRRLTGRIYTVRDDEAQDQKHMFDGERHQLAGVFDVKSFLTTLKAISCGLTFSLADTDLENLCHMGRRKGRLSVDLVQALEDAEDDDESEE